MHRLEPRRDDGFSMVEVVVALMIFAVLTATVSVSLGRLLSATRTDQARALAANLATRVIDRLHAVPAAQLPSGVQAPQTFTSDGHVFTVQTTTDLVAEGGGATSSACDSAGTLSARRINVVVTWTGMGSTSPVRADTLRRLSVSELDPTRGIITTRVVDRAGAPLADQVVTLTPGPVLFTTGANGCAVFPALAPGAYAVALGTAGFVDPVGNAAPARPVAASAGVVTRDPGFRYDRAARLAVSWPSSTDYPVPAGTGVLLGHSAFSSSAGIASWPGCPASTSRCAAPTGSGAVVEGLFPSTEGYRPWMGACADARTTSSPEPVVLQPGATGAAGVVPVRVDVQVVKKKRQVYPATVTAVHVSDAGCPDGRIVQVPVSQTDGRGRVALPPGSWTFTTAADPGDTTPDPAGMRRSETVSLVPGSTPTRVEVDV